MAARNSGDFIREAIESVVAQDFKHWELIVINDASHDQTSKIVEEAAAADPRIRVLTNATPLGPAKARNAGLEIANGDFIAFLDSDDLWLPAKLERQLEEMRAQKAVLSFTAYKKIDEFGRISKSHIDVPLTVTYRDLLKSNVIGCLTAMYDARALGKIPMPEDTAREDYRLWLEILKRSERKNRDSENHQNASVFKTIGINQVLGYYRIHSKSLSKNKLRAAKLQWQVYRRVERLPLYSAAYYFLHYACKGYWKFKSW